MRRTVLFVAIGYGLWVAVCLMVTLLQIGDGGVASHLAVVCTGFPVSLFFVVRSQRFGAPFKCALARRPHCRVNRSGGNCSNVARSARSIRTSPAVVTVLAARSSSASRLGGRHGSLPALSGAQQHAADARRPTRLMPTVGYHRWMPRNVGMICHLYSRWCGRLDNR